MCADCPDKREHVDLVGADHWLVAHLPTLDLLTSAGYPFVADDLDLLRWMALGVYRQERQIRCPSAT